MASTNKCLARTNKSGAAFRATKGYQPEGDVGEAKNKHLLPPPQSEEAEFDPALLTRGPGHHETRWPGTLSVDLRRQFLAAAHLWQP